MNLNQRSPSPLPIKGDLTLLYVSSWLIAVLWLIVSLTGLLYSTVIYPTEELSRAFVSNDAVNLFIGLPILLGSLWLTRRGKLVGLLCWPGALFFVLYNYIVYTFALQFHEMFLLYLALVMLSGYSLIGFITSIDGNAVQQRLTGAVPERFAGGVLVGLGLLFFLRVIAVIAVALANETPIVKTELATHTSDFLIAPAWVIGGVLLWRRKEFGYVAGLGLLFQASMLFVALVAFFLLQPFLTTAPFAITDVGVVFTLGLICFVPFVLFLRGVVARCE